MATSRLDMRIEKRVKAAAEKAAALTGKRSLTEYVTRLIEQDAERVIREHEAITLTDNIFDRFVAACDAASNPNAKLKAASKKLDELGIQ